MERRSERRPCSRCSYENLLLKVRHRLYAEPPYRMPGRLLVPQSDKLPPLRFPFPYLGHHVFLRRAVEPELLRPNPPLSRIWYNRFEDQLSSTVLAHRESRAGKLDNRCSTVPALHHESSSSSFVKSLKT